MEKRNENSEPERRIAQGPLTVDVMGKTVKIRGYACVFGSVYNFGWFTEEVHKDAFKGADLSDVRVLANHNVDRLFGRTKANTAAVGVDSVGLWYRCTLPNSTEAQALAESIARGDIDASSFGFSLNVTSAGNGDTWTKVNGRDHRVLTHIKTVYDVSPVTYPASPATSVYIDSTAAKRSFDAHYSTATDKRATGQLGAKFGSDLETEIRLLQLKMKHTQHALFDAKSASSVTRIATEVLSRDNDAAIATLRRKMDAFINKPTRTYKRY